MDILPLILIFAISVAAIFLWFRGKYLKSYSEGEVSNLYTVVLSLWLVVSVVFGANFFVLKMPGIFDITIERMLFLVIRWLLVRVCLPGESESSKWHRH